ncbi:MAG: endopeptidase La [bacterium]|nr:endopeptidase La [bacterium]
MTILLPEKKNQEKIVPVVSLRDAPLFPHTQSFLTFNRPRSLAALEAAFSAERLVCFLAQKKAGEEPGPEDLYDIGTIGLIDRIYKQNGEINLLVHGLSRVKVNVFSRLEPFPVAAVTELSDIVSDTDETKALTNRLKTQFEQAMKLGKGVDFLVFMTIMSATEQGEMTDIIASTLDIKPAEKQRLLESLDLRERMMLTTQFLAQELKILEIERKIAEQTQEKFDKTFKENVLRERIKTIEKELGEKDEEKEIKGYREILKKKNMPVEVKEKAEKEIKRLEQMSPYKPESSYLRAYLDWLTEMPWGIFSPNNADIKNAEKILEEDHYGLEKIKERIIEYLAVMKLRHSREEKEKKEGKAEKSNAVTPTILCFIGPPGVGKTSIGKSIARALGRKFARVSLGGIRDEAEIRGHRRTYVGALPGRIIQGIKQAGTTNPVFMLDEIDKIGVDFRGDPSAALLEALDPEQNKEFSDHYLDVPFDLSNVMFITTGNILDTIPPALRDRLEIIHFPGYTLEEKFAIAEKFLWEKELRANGLTEENVKIDKAAIRIIIDRYTREAGVRSLEREIAKALRKVAKKVADGKKDKTVITSANLFRFLGAPRFSSLLAEKKNEIGMTTGLAWTEAGGEVLFVEVALMPGKGILTLTGHLGEVMKESCQAALSYVRSRWESLGLSEKFYQKIDIHVHVPEGAVPKDGPSAGIAIATAIISALTKTPVRRDVGMTGEITLRGRVLEIGGIKEKILAAHRAGIKTVISPKENEKDVKEDIPAQVRKELKFVFVSHMDEVLKIALVRTLRAESPELLCKRSETPYPSRLGGTGAGANRLKT